MWNKMQSTTNSINADIDEKSLAEWPTLSDVCSNVKTHSLNNNLPKNTRNDSKRNISPMEKIAGDESAKENEDSSHHTNCRGARKKGSRQKWVPVPIIPPPYRKRFDRGNGRSFENGRGTFTNFGEKRLETCDYPNGQESGRGGSRTYSRFRGKRGRVYAQNYHQRREESSRGEIETKSNESKDNSDGEFLPTVMYYDPYVHSCYAAAARENELKKAIRNQIEYYFSEENLVSDIYMRRKMDSQGYVPLSLISSFRRVQNLTKNLKTIVEALNDSDKLEVCEDLKVRPVIDPLKWPLFGNDSQIFELRYDVPEFVPGQPYISSVIEGIRNLSFYEDVYTTYVSDNCMSDTESHFDMFSQSTSTVVEAT